MALHVYSYLALGFPGCHFLNIFASKCHIKIKAKCQFFLVKVSQMTRVPQVEYHWCIRYTKMSHVVYLISCGGDVYMMIDDQWKIYDIFSSIRYTSIYDCEMARDRRRLMSWTCHSVSSFRNKKIWWEKKTLGFICNKKNACNVTISYEYIRVHNPGTHSNQ